MTRVREDKAGGAGRWLASTRGNHVWLVHEATRTAKKAPRHTGSFSVVQAEVTFSHDSQLALLYILLLLCLPFQFGTHKLRTLPYSTSSAIHNHGCKYAIHRQGH